MPKHITPEDVLSFKSVTDAQINPAGGVIAFAVADSFTDGTALPRSNIWTVPTDGGKPTQFTNGASSDSTPRWSPDGDRLAFLSTRSGSRQVYIIHRDIGEAGRLTDVDGSISTARGMQSFSWSPDGSKIGFLMIEPDTEEDKRRAREKDDAVRFEQEPKYQRLYVADASTGRVECVSPPNRQIWEFGWSPDGGGFVAVASSEPYRYDWYLARLVRFESGDREARTLHQTKRQVSKPVWSPDGGRIAFLSSTWSDAGASGGSVFVMPADGGEAQELTGSRETSTNWLQWSDDSSTLISTAQELGGNGIALFDAESGERTSLWHTDGSTGASWPPCSRDRNGNYALIVEDPESPPNVHLARQNGAALDLKRLTDLHPQSAEFELGKTEIVHWEGADGWEIQGLLIRPPGQSEGPWPLLVDIHGGPSSMHANRYYGGVSNLGWLQYAASKGIAVLLPNPRGSTGWGIEFTEANIKDLGGDDWTDIVNGIDHCIDIGVADGDRLGITGWSYGGYLSGWAITHSDRFKAAAIGAAAPYRRSWHGNSGIKNWVATYLDYADPWDPDGEYKHYSFITYIKKVNTPTLVLHGDRDADVPIEQAHILYRALKEHGVETELVWYPGGGHGVTQRDQVLDIAYRATDWFVRHLVDGGV